MQLLYLKASLYVINIAVPGLGKSALVLLLIFDERKEIHCVNHFISIHIKDHKCKFLGYFEQVFACRQESIKELAIEAFVVLGQSKVESSQYFSDHT